MSEDLYSIILCGGKGERLWPYSTPEKPKPLIPFIENKTLLEHTIERCKTITDKICIITNSEQKEEVEKILGTRKEEILIEPTSKNTAPAILLSALYLYKKNPNALLAFFPSDAYIKDYLNFTKYVKIAAEYALKQDSICLFGLKPKFAACGYGYLEKGKLLDSELKIYKVSKFHEKPSKEIAQKYIQEKNMLWNIGMFVGKASVFIDEFKRHALEIYEKINLYEERKDIAIYESISPISFDYAIMEKSKNIATIPVDFDWYDVGNLEVFLSLKTKYKDEQNIIEIESKNNLIDIKNKTVALIGVSDLCIVEQNDALVIVHRSKVEDVKKITNLIKTKTQKLKNL